MDPRVKTSAEGLARQFALSKEVYDEIQQINATLAEIRTLRARLKTQSLAELDKRAEALDGAAPGGFEGAPVAPGAGKSESFNALGTSLRSLLGILQGGDYAPTPNVVAAVAEKKVALGKVMKDWETLKSEAK
jgi:hypothetical protein